MRKRNRVIVALSHLQHLHWVGLFRKLKVPDCTSSNGNEDERETPLGWW